MTAPAGAGRSLSVLVVDDSHDTADSLAEVLGLHGYTVRAAYGGEDALKGWAADPPNLVLIDIQMPGIGGLELARRIREQVSGKRPLLIALTGGGWDADLTDSAASEFDLYLVKPVEPAALARAIGRLCRLLGSDR
jgi:two-component system, OmpR family, response regulator